MEKNTKYIPLNKMSTNKKQCTERTENTYTETTLRTVCVLTKSVGIVLSKHLVHYICSFAPFHRYQLQQCLDTFPSYLQYRCCYETPDVPDHFHAITRIYCHVVSINTLDGYAEMNTRIVACRLCARYVFRDPLYRLYRRYVVPDNVKVSVSRELKTYTNTIVPLKETNVYIEFQFDGAQKYRSYRIFQSTKSTDY